MPLPNLCPRAHGQKPQDNNNLATPDESFAAFDSRIFSDRLSGDSALMREVINVFLDETPKSMHGLEITIKNQQKDEAARLAHTIKGSAANVGANQLHAIAAKVETACNTTAWREAEALVLKLKKQFEILGQAMRAFVQTLN